VRKKILFTGGSGLLALNGALFLRNDFEIYLGLHNRIVSLQGIKNCILELDNEQNLENELIRIKPDIIINAAGMTNVEECEVNPEEAKKINGIIPGMLARLSKKLNIYFVHISTDHLFDGTKSFQTEEDIVSPINEYGKSKAKGEQEVIINNKEALILRTNFFGWGTNYRQSFSEYIIKNLQLNKSIDLFYDVYYTPIFLNTLFDCIKFLIENKFNNIINIASFDKITKYEFGILLADRFKLNKNLINKVSIKSNPELVKRPLDMSLSSQKFNNLTGLFIPNISTQIELFYKQQFETEYNKLKDLK